MALWLVRAGKYGEHEQHFLESGKVYATWEGLKHNIGSLEDRKQLRATLEETYPEFGRGKVTNYVGQLWPFAHVMEPGDWVILPRKNKPAIAVAEILGPYEYDERAEDPYYHARKVKWIETDVPRSAFDQDLLYSFGAFMTICRLERNEAEARVRGMASSNWVAPSLPPMGLPPTASEDADTTDNQVPVDVEIYARDQIAKLIIRKYKGHGLTRLVDALLKARGYNTFRSPEGPDKGVDILAAPGPLGFGQPRICVQVKSSETPVDLPTLNQLVGTMQNVQAEQGLLVSWGGFKGSVDKETPQQFFRVRFWDQDDVIDELLRLYEDLPEEMRSEIPLKRVWAVSMTDQGDE